MTRCTSLFHIEQQCVIVAVAVNGDDLLQMAAGCTFVPQFLTRTAPVPGVTGFQCLTQAFLVHVCQHQNRFCIYVKCNRRNQFAFLKVFIQIVDVNFEHECLLFRFVSERFLQKEWSAGFQASARRSSQARQYRQLSGTETGCIL